jgi:adenine-specific DNA-methyltransferase
MIKYLGSKRRLVGVLGEIATLLEASTALDLFTGTTRVAQEFKKRGLHVTAADIATYSEVFADCYIALDRSSVDTARLQHEIERLNALPGRAGYFTKTFCEESRFFQPRNGARVDAIRDELESTSLGDPLYPVLLTALILAADRVDSTTGLQMAYLKKWAPRANSTLELRVPELLDGAGATLRGDALSVAATAPVVDLAYLDPPYNQHRYFTNYHVWESLVRWDRPDHYGVACKRTDSRDPVTKSRFNYKGSMPTALAEVIEQLSARTIVLSYNNESWLAADELRSLLLAVRPAVTMLSFTANRYVGARIGIHNPSGKKTGAIGHTKNLEYIFVAGDPEDVSRIDQSLGANTVVT